MQVLKLLVRVAVICNICFLAACLILSLPHPPNGAVVSTVIVMGCVIGLPVNAVGLSWAGILSMARKWRNVSLPVWLLAFNFVVLCLQFIYLILHLR
jgi:hypothetical protein